MTEPILILGATGSTGRRVTRLLQQQGHDVRPASRTGQVRFDWTDPATWAPAVGDATRMYLMMPEQQPLDPAFLNCAIDRGVTRIVLLSSGGIEVMGDERLMTAERLVRECGVEWTILRPSWFNQNFDEGFFQPAIMAGELAMPLGDLRQAFVDADDIAAVAVAALTEDGHAGQSYSVQGPRALSFGEVLAIIGRAAGRKVRYLDTAEDYLAAQTTFGVPLEQAQREVDAFDALRALGDEQPGDTVLRVTGRPPKDFETYTREAAARGAWRA